MKAMDAKRAKLEESAPWAKPGIEAAVRGAKWLQGPVDKYGLALYLSGRATGAFTLVAVTAAVQQGMDIEAVLQSWGFANGAAGGGVGSVVGSLATAALLNAAFTPLHFAVAVYGTKAQERAARSFGERAVALEASGELAAFLPKGQVAEDPAIQRRGKDLATVPAIGDEADGGLLPRAHETDDGKGGRGDRDNRGQGGGGSPFDGEWRGVGKEAEEGFLAACSILLFGATVGVALYSGKVLAGAGIDAAAAAASADPGEGGAPSGDPRSSCTEGTGPNEAQLHGLPSSVNKAAGDSRNDSANGAALRLVK
mmetsp:Transcript_65940/g.148826  ORF Transcript_65940/g.148826 Transcript_65940/m.148826 type:complete len:311 (+) Transcript_65940:725-1657(+)